MNIRHIAIAIAAILVITAAWKVSQERAPTTEIAAGRLYPKLIDQLNDIQRVSIHSLSKNMELAKSEDGWVVANRDNYPANFSAIKRLLLNLSEVVVIEQKTSKAENYPRIGVQEIDDEDSDSVLLRIEHRDGTELVALIIGNERNGKSLDLPNYYVRKSNAASALLVEGELNVSANQRHWMDTHLVNIDTTRVRTVTINRDQESPIVVSKAKRSDNFFTLQAIPAGFTAKSRTIISSLGAVLLDVKFDDVAAAKLVQGLPPSVVTKVQTFDGLVATLEQIEFEDTVYVRFGFEFDPEIVADAPPASTADESADEDDKSDDAAAAEPPSIADEAATLNAKLNPWVYVLPDYKRRMIDKRFDDMIKPTEDDSSDSGNTSE